MKRTDPKKTKTSRKRTVARTVDEYIAQIPDASRSNFDKLRSAIRSVVPRDATEIISYGMPAFRGDKVLVWFAAFAEHCSLFPTPSVIEELRNELEGFTISKGTVQFPNRQSIPIALVKKLVKARLAVTKSAVKGAKEG